MIAGTEERSGGGGEIRSVDRYARAHENENENENTPHRCTTLTHRIAHLFRPRLRPWNSSPLSAAEAAEPEAAAAEDGPEVPAALLVWGVSCWAAYPSQLVNLVEAETETEPEPAAARKVTSPR